MRKTSDDLSARLAEKEAARAQAESELLQVGDSPVEVDWADK